MNEEENTHTLYEGHFSNNGKYDENYFHIITKAFKTKISV